MANKTVNQLTEALTADADDFIQVWRATEGDARKIEKSNFIGASILGGGEIDTGGFTLTISADASLSGDADETEAEIAGAVAKTTPVDADTMPLTDSEASSALKKVTWANIKATLKTYFDTLYGALASANTWTAGQTIAQPTVGNAVLTLSSVATGDDPTEIYYHGRGATTNATQTTIVTIPISASNTYLITAEMIGRRTGGVSGTADWGLVGRTSTGYTTISGTVTSLGNLQSTEFAGASGYTHLLTISGTNVLVQVIGAANNNVTWHAFVTVKKVGS